MLKLGLVGEGIKQSQSPDLHERLGQLFSIPVSYQLFDSKEQARFLFSEKIQQLRLRGYRGVNVTYPFKEMAMNVADVQSEGAQRVGSSNTLLFEGKHIRAENTDYTGFINAYRYNFTDRNAGRVLLIGAGGVGRAVAAALGNLGCEHLYILEPDTERGKKLSAALMQQGMSVSCVDATTAAELIPELDGLVNCSPVGHINHPGCPIDAGLIRKHHWVFDAVYVPAKTELIKASLLVGADILSGVDLFVFQGMDAFRFFAETDNRTIDITTVAVTIRDHYFQQLVQFTKS